MPFGICRAGADRAKHARHRPHESTPARTADAGDNRQTVLTELRHRDPVLFWTGAAMLLSLIVVTLLSISDTRLILGLNPWIKPMKFFTSITIFLWTVAWFMPETTSAKGRAIVRWVIGPAMTIEMIGIVTQAARGTTSHFNFATPFDAAIFSIMGVTILVNTIAMVVFLAIIRRDTPPSRAGYISGIKMGVLLFLLASAEGALIVANNAHTVGAPDGGPGLPFLNWSTAHGDLRIAHFFGMHAMQALPLLGFLLDKGLPADARWAKAGNLVLATGVVWVAITGGLLLMALQGMPLIKM